MGCSSSKATDSIAPSADARTVPVVEEKPAEEQAIAKMKTNKESKVSQAAAEAAGDKEPETIEQAAEIAAAAEDALLHMDTNLAQHDSNKERSVLDLLVADLETQVVNKEMKRAMKKFAQLDTDSSG